MITARFCSGPRGLLEESRTSLRHVIRANSRSMLGDRCIPPYSPRPHSCEHLFTTGLISLPVLYVVDTCFMRLVSSLLFHLFSSDTASHPLCRFSHIVIFVLTSHIALCHWAAGPQLQCCYVGRCQVADISGSGSIISQLLSYSFKITAHGIIGPPTAQAAREFS
jgi:hypothetical protein